MTDLHTPHSAWDDPAFDPPRRLPVTSATMNIPGTFPRPSQMSREDLVEDAKLSVKADPSVDICGSADRSILENEYTLRKRVKQEPASRESTPVQDFSRHGHEKRPREFPNSSTAEDLSFMEWYPNGNATITFFNTDGDLKSISGLDPVILEERCPLLAHALEPTRIGPRLHLEALNPTTATPFLRYLYTGSYALYVSDSDLFEDVPTSVLLHCQLYRLGDIYDLPGLKQQASVNVTRQCEFGCSSPDKPIDLCDAVKFLYEHLPEHSNLIDTIICYCVSCFSRHQLADDLEFRTMAYNLRPFHQDLCKECMKREFEDDTAAAIIQMPFKPYIPDSYASREDIDPKRLRDVVHHFHGDDDVFEAASRKRKRPDIFEDKPSAGQLLLALRARRREKSEDTPSTHGAESGHHDTVVSRRLDHTNIAKEEPTIKEEGSAKPQALSSDSEYEVISPSAGSDLALESDSETEGLLVVRPTTSYVPQEQQGPQEQQTCTLPIRPSAVRSSLVVTNPDLETTSDSESEWTVV